MVDEFFESFMQSILFTHVLFMTLTGRCNKFNAFIAYADNSAAVVCNRGFFSVFVVAWFFNTCLCFVLQSLLPLSLFSRALRITFPLYINLLKIFVLFVSSRIAFRTSVNLLSFLFSCSSIVAIAERRPLYTGRVPQHSLHAIKITIVRLQFYQ